MRSDWVINNIRLWSLAHWQALGIHCWHHCPHSEAPYPRSSKFLEERIRSIMCHRWEDIREAQLIVTHRQKLWCAPWMWKLCGKWDAWWAQDKSKLMLTWLTRWCTLICLLVNKCSHIWPSTRRVCLELHRDISKSTEDHDVVSHMQSLLTITTHSTFEQLRLRECNSPTCKQ